MFCEHTGGNFSACDSSRNLLHVSSFVVCGSSVKQVSHSWHIVLDSCALYTFLNFIYLCTSFLNLYPDSELIIFNIINKNLHSIAPLRSTTAHRLRHGRRAGKGPGTRVGRPGEYSGALRRRCADLHSRRPQGTQGHCWTEALATVCKKFSTEGNRLGTSEVGCVATEGRRHSVAEAHSTPSRKGLAARRVRTLQTFPSPFRASVSAVDATLHCRGIKPARTSLAGSQIRVSSEKRRTRDQRSHCRCVAWISSAGKRGTHRIRTSVCLWCCG